MIACSDDEMKKFFGGLRQKDSTNTTPRCIICGNPIPKKRIEKFPKTGFCKAECSLKWLDKENLK